jgi:mannose-1-phosphate guanylyltransferase
VVAKAAILCGGEGKRLRPLTDYFQKTMIPIGRKRRPLLEYTVRLIVYHGVRDLVLLCGYKADEIENYFGDGGRFGATIAYSRDPTNAKGSAQALMYAIESGKIGQFDDLLVYYGDVLSTLDVKALLARKRESRAAVALVLSKEYAVPVGVAEVRKNRVVSFREKPNLNLDVTMGCLVISKSCIPVLRESTAEGGTTDIMTHFVPRVLERGLKVVPFYFKGFWFDVGTTEAYEKLDQEKLEEDLNFLE